MTKATLNMVSFHLIPVSKYVTLYLSAELRNNGMTEVTYSPVSKYYSKSGVY